MHFCKKHPRPLIPSAAALDRYPLAPLAAADSMVEPAESQWQDYMRHQCELEHSGSSPYYSFWALGVRMLVCGALPPPPRVKPPSGPPAGGACFCVLPLLLDPTFLSVALGQAPPRLAGGRGPGTSSSSRISSRAPRSATGSTMPNFPEPQACCRRACRGTGVGHYGCSHGAGSSSRGCLHG
jgi:hypothetical protein